MYIILLPVNMPIRCYERKKTIKYIALGEKNYQTFMKTTIGTLPYAVIFYLL